MYRNMMSKMNELTKVLVEQMRRSGLSVTLLVMGIWGVWTMRNTDIRELRMDMQSLKEEHRKQATELMIQLSQCSSDRERLNAKVAVMEIQIDYLTGARAPKNKNE